MSKHTLPDGLSSLSPHIRLNGTVDDAMLEKFLNKVHEFDANESQLVIEMTTLGGDADTGRRIAQEVRLLRDYQGLDVAFIGKSAVYSAGMTIMAAFAPNRRFVTRDTMLLIHERRMEKELKLAGAMRSSLALVNDLKAEIESAQLLEDQGFRALVEGTKLSLEQLRAKVLARDWYVSAEEALAHQLVAALI